MEGVEKMVVSTHRKYVTMDNVHWEYGDNARPTKIDIFRDTLVQPDVHYYEYMEAFDRSGSYWGTNSSNITPQNA